MADPTQQLQQMLNNAESSFGGLNSAGQQLAAQLLRAASAGNTQTTAATATSQSLAQLTARSQSVDAGLKNIGGALVGLINQATNLTAGIYGADKAFTSVTPTVDAVASVLSKVITGLGQLTSGITVLGFSLGNASAGLANFANTGLEVVTNILKFQLETSQKVADGFIASVKAGAMFGGSITRLGQSAASLFVPLQTLVKVITANVESLSKLGLGQERAGLLVAGMTKQVFNSSESLRVMYGGFDELAVGVAQYLELQSQLGVNVQNDARITKDAAIEYLFRQRELSAITGKNTDLLKKEEQGRRTQLDYNLKLGRLGEVAKANVSEGMALSGKLFGDLGSKYAQEFFATGGKVISKEMLTFAYTNQEAASAIAQLMSNVDQSSATFRSGNAAYLQANAPALEAYARSLESFAELNRAANNPILRAQTETGAAILENLTLLKDLTGQYAGFEAERNRRLKEALDPATKAFAEAQKELLINQTEIDKTVLKNMESIGATLKLFNDIQRGFVSLQAEANDTLNKIIKSGFSSSKYVEELVNRILNIIINPPTRPPSPVPVQPPPVPTGPPSGPNNPPPSPAAPPNPPGPISQSTPLLDESRERMALLQSEIDRLNRELVVIRNTPPPVNGENIDLQTAILAELQDHSTKLDRIRDALA